MLRNLIAFCFTIAVGILLLVILEGIYAEKTATATGWRSLAIDRVIASLRWAAILTTITTLLVVPVTAAIERLKITRGISSVWPVSLFAAFVIFVISPQSQQLSLGALDGLVRGSIVLSFPLFWLYWLSLRLLRRWRL